MWFSVTVEFEGSVFEGKFDEQMASVALHSCREHVCHYFMVTPAKLDETAIYTVKKAEGW